MSGSGAVAQAVGGVTEEGTPFGHAKKRKRMLLAENDGGRPGTALQEPIDFRLAHSPGRPGGIFLRVFDKKLVGVGTVVVGTVLPDVPGHVIKTVGIWRV